MVKERKHKQWKANKKRYYRSQDNSAKFLIFGLLVLSTAIALKNNSQLTRINSLKDYSSNLSNLNDISQKYSVTDNNDKSQDFAIAGSIDDFKNIDFTKIDNYASSVRYQGTSVFELASLLSRYARTEAEKARIIYSWIAYNITYDVPAYLSGNYGDLSPQGVLQSRKGVCSGYANLYKALAIAMGLDAVTVEGYAKGYGYVVGNTTQINHAWNATKINNKWYLLDPTWGAGNINNEQFNQHFNPYYFATPPEQFIFNHFPTENKLQLLSTPYTKQQFDTTPKFFPEFFKNNLHLVSHPNYIIDASSSFQVILSAPKDITALARLKFGSSYLNDTYTFVQRKDNNIIVTVSPPGGTYELEIFSKNKDISQVYQQAMTYKVISNNTGEEFPKIYSTFSDRNSYLYAPLNKQLFAGSVYFKIEVPDALEVQVIDTSSNKWVQLTRSGSTFEGNVPVSSNKIQVAAKFPENKDYWTLVEYNQ